MQIDLGSKNAERKGDGVRNFGDDSTVFSSCISTLVKKIVFSYLDSHDGKDGEVKESAATVWLNMVSEGASLRSAAGCNSRSAEKCGGKPVYGEGSMGTTMKTTRQRRGEPVESVCSAQVRPEGVPSGYHRGSRSVFVEW